MMQMLRLLLPALIPSWRFFKSVEPSPRVQWAITHSRAETSTKWQDYRPRPQWIGPSQMLARLFWNPWWNECLHMLSLSERVIADPTEYALIEMVRKIRADLPDAQANRGHLHLRMVHLSQGPRGIHSEETFRTAPIQLAPDPHDV